MSAIEFSEWPGAWERHVIRKTRHPHFFFRREPPSQADLLHAQSRDQQELTQLNEHLAALAVQCTALTEDSSSESIAAIKMDLDHCYDTACGLGADLKEQKDALSMLNEVITTAVRRALRENDEHHRLVLIKQESLRMRHLTRLNYPIVCDLLRSVSPIPVAETAAAMLCETDEAFTVALDVLDDTKRRYLADGIQSIEDRLQDSTLLFRIDRKQKILHKRLLASHAIEEAETG